MSTSTTSSPVASPRALTAAPITQPSEVKGPTRWNIIFTPGGSSVIKDNLIRVYENREYRIYGAYLTGVTAIRSALEIIPSFGKLLLNTATWFVDITSPRGDGITIIARDFADVINCIKATIALPFFSIAGLVFPSDVFGLFENMPGIQTKVEILDEKAILAQVKTKRASEERNLTAAEEELQAVQTQLEEIDELLTTTTEQLEAVQQQIEGSEGAAAEAERLKTEVRDLTSDVARLRGEEGTVSTTLGRIRDEITKLGPELEGAKANHTSALESLERERTAKHEQLQRIQDQIKQTGERQTAAQTEFDRFSTIVRDLSPKAATLRADVERLEAARPALVEHEKALLARIQTHKDELTGLEAQVTEARERTRVVLDGLKQQIAAQQTVIDERAATIDRLGSEQKDIELKRKGLIEKCNDLEFTTLHGLNGRKDALDADIQSLDTQKAALGTEIAAQTEALRTEKEAVKSSAGRVHDLQTTIAGLEQREGNFRTTVLPELERQSKALEDQKAALAKEVSAEQLKLDGVKATHADTVRDRDSVARSLEAKRAEQASLELTLKSIQQALKGSPVSGAVADGSANPEQTIAALRRELDALGSSISEAADRDTTLRALVADQEIALKDKAQTVSRLTGEASFLDSQVQGLKTQEADLNTRLSRLGEEIGKLEAKEKTLKERNTALDEQVRTATASLEKIAARHKELEAQVRAAEGKKAAAETALTGLSDQIAAAKRERGEIQGVIDGLRPNIDSMRTALSALETEKARLDDALPKLRVEEQTLTGQIADAKQELTRLKETLTSAQGTHDVEMKKLEEARTRLSDEKGRLESENQAKIAARDTLQSELDKLTASTASLRGQETTLQDSVRAAEQAQLAAIERTAQETEAFKKLQAQTQACAAHVGVLSQRSIALTEANQKLEAEFEAKRAAFEETLRLREKEAVAAVDRRLEEIRMGSPVKAKLGSPAKAQVASTAETGEESVPPTPVTAAEDLTTVRAKLKQKAKEYERAERAVIKKQSELEAVTQECSAYRETFLTKLAATKEELAHVTAEKEEAEQALAATMSEPEYAALIKKRLQELDRIRLDRARIGADVKKLRQDRDAGSSAAVAATPARKTSGSTDGTDTEARK